MSAPATVPGLDRAPTTHPRLLAWVREVAELTTPDRVVWCDGSEAEWRQLTDELVESGTLVRLNDERKPNSFWARTDPSDVARVEERTFICAEDQSDARSEERRVGKEWRSRWAPEHRKKKKAQRLTR